MVKLNTQKNLEAYEDWVADSIKGFNKTRSDTGKFLLTVGTSSIGVFVSVSKFSSTSLDIPGMLALLSFLIATGLAISLVLPLLPSIQWNDNVQTKHLEFVIALRKTTKAWFVLWMIGASLATLSLSGLLSKEEEKVEKKPTKIEIVNLPSADELPTPIKENQNQLEN